MNFRRRSLICLFLSCTALIASVAVLLLSENPTNWSTYLFYTASLLFSALLFFEYRNLVTVFSRSWYWFSWRHLWRMFALLAIFSISMVFTTRQSKIFDFTAEAFYSLSADSIAFWRQFDFKLIVIANQQEHSSFYTSLQRFSELLESHLPERRVEWIDPIRTPSKVKALELLEIPCLLLEINNEKLPIGTGRLFSRVGPANSELEFHGEAVLTESITRLHNKKTVFLYNPTEGTTPFINNAPIGFSAIQDILRRDGFQPEILKSMPATESETPLLLFLPTTELSSAEQAQILERRKQSVPTILFFDAQPHNPFPQMETAWQIGFVAYPIIDLQRHFRNEATLIAAIPAPHPINTGSNVGQNPAILPGSTAFAAIEGELSPILQTSTMSWAKTVFNNDEEFPHFDPEHDIKGPLFPAVDAGNNILLFADTDFVRNQFLGLGGNHNLLLNSVHYICGNLDLMTARGKRLRNRELNMSTPNKKFMYVLMIFIIPFLFLSTAVVMHFSGCRD